jgi:preprotein translocase subunit YajC
MIQRHWKIWKMNTLIKKVLIFLPFLFLFYILISKDNKRDVEDLENYLGYDAAVN